MLLRLKRARCATETLAINFRHPSAGWDPVRLYHLALRMDWVPAGAGTTFAMLPFI
jgi:hypothetical protein